MTMRKAPAIALVVGIVLGGLSIAAWSQGTAKRSDLRAFYTAPPVIPHEVTTERNSKACMVCHKNVLKLGDRVSVRTPHPKLRNCLQCHVRAAVPEWMISQPSVENAWQGLEEPTIGSRAHVDAPPVIPHRLFLRRACLICHGPKHPNEAMRTSHPERTSCRQCHVADRNAEF
ncbi:MAG TPA: hypothetical protein QGH10_25160 [Armatimonadota bacterium]|nr:hypothetical protein [Armatimonadota bacterium]